MRLINRVVLVYVCVWVCCIYIFTEIINITKNNLEKPNLFHKSNTCSIMIALSIHTNLMILIITVIFLAAHDMVESNFVAQE